MYRRILVAVEDYEQVDSLLELVKDTAVQGVTEVRALHLRLRELSGLIWYARETRDQAALVAEAAAFDLRMAGVSAGSQVRYAFVDKAAEVIVDEAVRWSADLIILGSPRRRELAARLFGSVTQRVLQRSACPVLVSPRDPARSGRRPAEPNRSIWQH